jgi:3-oxoacyl-[acyl-carrier-protein] synthase II
MQLKATELSNRVVITGVGPVACCGIGVENYWRALVEGQSGLGYITRFDVSDLPVRIGGEIHNFDPTDYMRRRDAVHAGRFTHLAAAAAQLAVQDAGLDLGSYDPYQMGVSFGSSSAGFGSVADETYRIIHTRGDEYADPMGIVEIPAHAAASHILINLGIKGPNASFSTGCSTGLEAIAYGARMVREGRAQVVVAGASESCLSRNIFFCLCQQNAMATDPNPLTACRPWDVTRTGLVLSEGAGAVILERADLALDRGAQIYAEVVGHGSTVEARHMVFADASGVDLAQAYRLALKSARLSAVDIDYACAHGIGSKDYDLADTRALKLALGPRAYTIAVSSIKPITGQPFAASGALTTIATAKTVATGLIPGTLNHHQPDADCDLDYVPARTRASRVDTALINAHSFGGTHAVLVLRRFAERAD